VFLPSGRCPGAHYSRRSTRTFRTVCSRSSPDWLAVGLDPTKSNVHFVLQSQVPERHELSVLLMMIAEYSEVMRNPTLKSELKNQKSATMGFMAYPVDQVADIYMVSPTPPERGDRLLVPVGEDQVPHLEYARVLARRFNRKYGSVFVPCSALVGDVGRLVGTDGQAKMSKSLGNTINLADDPKTVESQVMRMFTDPKRTRSDIPGETENNPVFIYHRAFNPDIAEVADLTERYQQGKVGDVEVKRKLAKALNDFLDPIRDRRVKFAILISGKFLKQAVMPPGKRVFQLFLQYVTHAPRLSTFDVNNKEILMNTTSKSIPMWRGITLRLSLLAAVFTAIYKTMDNITVHNFITAPDGLTAAFAYLIVGAWTA